MFSSNDNFLSDQRLLGFLKSKRDDRIQKGASLELMKTAQKTQNHLFSVRSSQEIGNVLPNNPRLRRTCYALCPTLEPVSAALTIPPSVSSRNQAHFIYI